MRCSIRIKGHLDPSQAGTVLRDERLSTRMRAPPDSRVREDDQAALYGILIKIRGLGLTLLTLEASEAVAPSASGEPF